MTKSKAYTLATLFFCVSIQASAYQAPKAAQAPIIDGIANDPAWQTAAWHSIDHFIIGDPTESQDFSGKFKVVWTPRRLFVLAEITDDVLLDRNPNPLEKYWEDDLLEVLLDEDASGGLHHSSYNAFAYHVSLDNQAVDIGENGEPRLLNEHLDSHWRRDPGNNHRIVWEISIQIFNESFSDQALKNNAVALTGGKKMGFMMAYCDADDPANGREHFITSHDIQAVDGDKNRAYLDASVFGVLTLIDD